MENEIETIKNVKKEIKMATYANGGKSIFFFKEPMREALEEPLYKKRNSRLFSQLTIDEGKRLKAYMLKKFGHYVYVSGSDRIYARTFVKGKSIKFIVDNFSYDKGFLFQAFIEVPFEDDINYFHRLAASQPFYKSDLKYRGTMEDVLDKIVEDLPFEVQSAINFMEELPYFQKIEEDALTDKIKTQK